MRRVALLAAAAFLSGCVAARTVPGPATAVDWTRMPPVPGWNGRADAALAATDPAVRRDLFVALTRDALQGSGHEVHVAGTQSPLEPSPDDYLPLPAVNFDVNLNSKASRKFTAATESRSLEDNAAYFFSHQRVPYVVLGPGVIKPGSADFLRMYVDHELYHAEHHIGDRRPRADHELETWVRQFRHWFYRIRSYRQKWGPMLQYYEAASPDEQQKALAALIDYYRHPPEEFVHPGQVATARTEFRKWLQRRTADELTGTLQLVIALNAAGL